MPNRSRIASGSQPAPTASRTRPPERAASWSRIPTRTPRPVRTWPASGTSVPASTRRRVDLPLPLMPTTPRRSRSVTVTDSSSNNTRSERDTETPAASTMTVTLSR